MHLWKPVSSVEDFCTQIGSASPIVEFAAIFSFLFDPTLTRRTGARRAGVAARRRDAQSLGRQPHRARRRHAAGPRLRNGASIAQPSSSNSSGRVRRSSRRASTPRLPHTDPLTTDLRLRNVVRRGGSADRPRWLDDDRRAAAATDRARQDVCQDGTRGCHRASSWCHRAPGLRSTAGDVRTESARLVNPEAWQTPVASMSCLVLSRTFASRTTIDP
jgi:hypothetical protein